MLSARNEGHYNSNIQLGQCRGLFLIFLSLSLSGLQSFSSFVYSNFKTINRYPSDVDKHVLARQTGLSRRQISNWFINARVRLWKPMVEEMYMEEKKEQDNANQSLTTPTECESSQNPNPNPDQDQKPILPIHIGYTDSDLLTSIMVTNNNPGYEHDERPRAENFGVADLDFSSYDNNAGDENSGNRVSLTLGLQQWIFFSGDRQALDDCEQVQFSI